MARLIPDAEKICTGQDLAEALERAELPPAGARQWHKDLAKAKKALKAPEDKGQ